MTLIEFLNDCPNAILWYTSTGLPTGTTEFVAFGYADSIAEREDWQAITGTVTNGVWEWGGSGNPTDCRRNTVLRITVQSDPEQWDRLKSEYDSEV